jgi:hypothetical protein
MQRSRAAAVRDLGRAALGLVDTRTWGISEKLVANPLDAAEWDAASSSYVSTDAAVAEDDFIAHAMVLLMMRRMIEGWSRQTGCRLLTVWEGPQDNLADPATQPNLWHATIAAAKAQGQLGKQHKKLAHEDNYWTFNNCYHCTVWDQKWERVWARDSESHRVLNHVAEQAAVQWALLQEPALVETAALLLLEMMDFARVDPTVLDPDYFDEFRAIDLDEVRQRRRALIRERAQQYYGRLRRVARLVGRIALFIRRIHDEVAYRPGGSGQKRAREELEATLTIAKPGGKRVCNL